MKRGGLFMVLGVAALAFVLVWGVAALYRLRVARGDVFPEYSSLRADPLGTRALHDAAGLLAGRESVRWLRPLRRLEAGAGDVVVVAGADRRRRGGMSTEDWAALDRAVSKGARVVVAWRAEASRSDDFARAREILAEPWAEGRSEEELAEAASERGEPPDAIDADEEADERDAGGEKKAAKKTRAEKDAEAAKAEEARRSPAPPSRIASERERRWGYRLMRRELVDRVDEDDARRGEGAPDAWPATLARWRSDLYFLPREGEGWRVLYRRGSEPVLMERVRGAGAVLLLADSFVLSNEAVQRERATPVLAAVLGDARRVVFVESHLGLKTDTGVAVLARRYGLGSAAFTALVLAALWIWRRAAPLAPIIPEDAEVRLTLAPTAGLEALLRRAVAPNKLFAACLEAWRPGATPNDQSRIAAEPAAAGIEAGVEPVAAYNAATRTLSRKKLS